MPDPRYQPDVSGLVADLERKHGRGALDVASENARQHMQVAAWKHAALWLQVVNQLNAGQQTRLF